MPEALAPAYYAGRTTGWRRDLWALLHPPYTAWHLSYVLIGASLAPRVSVARLVATLLAFFLAVGISAHALDELRGRPLQTSIPSSVLWTAAAIGLLGAVALGIAGLAVIGPWLLPFIALGIFFVFAYNLELLRGRVHGDFWFALSWGAFPVLTAYFAQTSRISVAALAAAAAQPFSGRLLDLERRFAGCAGPARIAWPVGESPRRSFVGSSDAVDRACRVPFTLTS
jgi:hypothetical protein